MQVSARSQQKKKEVLFPLDSAQEILTALIIETTFPAFAITEEAIEDNLAIDQHLDTQKLWLDSMAQTKQIKAAGILNNV